MLWSYLVGPRGRVVVVEAVADYVENIRQNLEHHLNWPLRNVLYVAKGVDAKPGETRIQIGTVADYNKLSGQSIDDGLTDGSYARELTVETDTLGNILAQLDLREVHHIHMTISGMEVEALKGMEQILSRSGLRVHIRSLHSKDGALLYPEVVKRLREHGMKAVVGQHTAQFQGADVYAAKV
jgi:FkbM family methyltransferase